LRRLSDFPLKNRCNNNAAVFAGSVNFLEKRVLSNPPLLEAIQRKRQRR
jgi:hypothetical protein